MEVQTVCGLSCQLPCLCGNGSCQTACGETPQLCPTDCATCVCGNGFCQAGCGENPSTCPFDCGFDVDP
jgi:hypothetical protein